MKEIIINWLLTGTFLFFEKNLGSPNRYSVTGSYYVSMHCCECRFNCSARRERVNISLRSWKGFQWLSICWVTLCCEGMTVTSSLETEFSSRTKDSEVSMRRLSCGNMRVSVSCYWGIPSWDLSPPLAPPLTCDGDGAQTSFQSYWSINLEWMSKGPSQVTNREVVV